ncbi:hypothetical protein GFS31_10000 [Leptolyngbya sp. BL0902]|nr:hypothetical protein GFS31_10000 [Leptolyngbya sp. BL0902]
MTIDPHPTSLSHKGKETLKGFPAPLSCLGEGLGVRANPSFNGGFEKTGRSWA